MKKILSAFMIAVCCLTITMPTQAQPIRFGVKDGVNLTKVDWGGGYGDNKDNATDFFIGLMAEVTTPIIGLGVDGTLLFSQRGKGGGKQTGLNMSISLKYIIDLGSMLGVFVAAGPDSFFSFSGDRKYVDEAIELERKKAMVGINVDAGVELIKHLRIGVNYNILLGDSYRLREAGEVVTDAKNRT